jgi:CSLREA domain-containing protein
MNRRAPLALTRLLPLGALLVAAATGCDDHTFPTAPGLDGVAFTQVASAPVVNSLADPGTGVCDETECTLREAIAFATSGATITFAVTGTITLSASHYRLIVDKSLAIRGPGAEALTVSGGGATQIFLVLGGANAQISSLTMSDGYHIYSGGGALHVTNAVLTLDTVVVRNSTVTGSGLVFGGGIAVAGASATLTLRHSTVSGNTATSTDGGHGGGISNSGTLVLENSTVSGNTAHAGAGIYSFQAGAKVSLVNSTVSGNSAGFGYGGGIRVDNGSLTIAYSTVSGNSSAGPAGGILSQDTLTLLGALVSGNTASSNPDLHESRAGVAWYTLIGSADGHSVTGGTDGNIVGSDPLLAALASNGGPTQTHALGTGSPAIDHIPSGTLGCGTTTDRDQRGVARPQGSGCDIGAYEKEGSGGLLTPTFTFDLSTLPAQTYGDDDFSVASYVTTNSSGTVSFATGSSSVGCSVTSAGLVAITGAATGSSYCVIDATLAPDATYTGAGPLAQQFNIAKAATSVTIANMPTGALVGGGFTPTYTTASDGATSTASSTPAVCTVSGGVVSFTAEGTCTLVASVAEGTNHLAATGSEQSVMVSPPDPPAEFASSCTFTLHPKNGQRLVTVAWENAVPGVTLIQLVDGRTVTKQMAPTTTGSWSTNVKEDPTYALSGGEGRKDTSVQLVGATPCEGPN